MHYTFNLINIWYLLTVPEENSIFGGHNIANVSKVEAKSNISSQGLVHQWIKEVLSTATVHC